MRIFFTGIAVLLLVASGLLTLSRFLVVDVTAVARAAAFSTYAVVGYAVVIVLLLLVVRGAQHRQLVLFGAVLALLGIALHAYWIAPLYYGSAAGDDADLTVMTSNLDHGHGDPSAVVRAAAERHVDVLVLQEVTPTELTLLDRAGLGELFTERAGRAGGQRSTMVFSSYALSDESTVPVENGGVAVTVAAPQPFRLLAAHTISPAYGVLGWRSDLHALETLSRAAVRAGPTVVAGDLNATTDNAEFRRLLGAGLSDTRAQANSGWGPTWPTRYRHPLFRPVITIDHVLTSPAYSAVSVRTVDIPDTDHRAVVVQLDRL